MRTASRAEHDLQCLATFVHGALAALHALGVGYNFRRRNWFDVAAHSAAMAYDVWATAKHLDAWGRTAAHSRVVAMKEIPSP
ncbi:MAG: hypothetical protein DMG12_15950 [Acidobacteria bacterium]|nr:MAG: hypothetical protein DMG12_15950 [Acidobacteriota bacterium]